MSDNEDDKKYTVTGSVKNIELTQLGDAIKLLVFKREALFGTFYIGRGSLKWIPEGKHKRKAKRISWGQMSRLFEDSRGQ